MPPQPTEKVPASGLEAALPENSIGLLDGGLEADDGLPPRDRGRAAWTCLAAISVISMATWGKHCL